MRFVCSKGLAPKQWRDTFAAAMPYNVWHTVCEGTGDDDSDVHVAHWTNQKTLVRCFKAFKGGELHRISDSRMRYRFNGLRHCFIFEEDYLPHTEPPHSGTWGVH